MRRVMQIIHLEPAVAIGLAIAILEAILFGLNNGLSITDATRAAVPLIVAFLIRTQVEPTIVPPRMRRRYERTTHEGTTRR